MSGKYSAARMRPYRGLYGQVAIDKQYCWMCRRHAFVIDGLIQCCDRPVSGMPQSVKREICPEFERRLPSLVARRECLERQNNRCLYCEREFGTVVFRGLRKRVLKINWDHVVPWAYSQDNRDANFVAACCVCNGLKSSTLYPSLESAQVDLRHKWTEAGYV